MQCAQLLILQIPINTEGVFLLFWAGKQAFTCLACFYSGRDMVVLTWPQKLAAFCLPTHACEHHSYCRLTSLQRDSIQADTLYSESVLLNPLALCHYE